MKFHLIAALNVLSAVPGALISANEIRLRGAAAQWNIFEDVVDESTQAQAIEVEGFEAAKPLEFFENIDPNKFEWVNKSEIQPGETTCGFLKAPLVWNSDSGWPEEGDTNYPSVKVYVCVKFAKQQPAPRGNLAVHCGGPSSLSACVTLLGGANSLGEESADSYNIIGFDQRGLGRSSPTHVRPECSVHSYGYSAANSNLDLNDDDSIRSFAQVFKRRNIECWKQPDFQLTSNSGKTYHFLEHSGTRQLAEDIERVRGLFGNQKLSVYGVSYGTTVFGTYATMFPNNVHLMVLDSNMNPVADIVEFSEDQVRSMNQRIDYFIAGCEFGDGCHVNDLSKCMKDLNEAVNANKEKLKEKFVEGSPSSINIFMRILAFLMAHVDIVPDVCSAASQHDYDTLEKLLFGDQGQANEKEVAFLNLPHEMDSDSKPTSGKVDPVDWPFEDYDRLKVEGTASLILSQDMAFGAYNEDLFVNTVKGWNEKYPGASTQGPARRGAHSYAGCYYWPNSTPLPPMGNAVLNGIVTGQVYDPATPYITTTKMRQNFPNTHLLTSRSFNHGLHKATDLNRNGGRCQDHVVHYFATGEMDFTDGYVCESESISDACTFEKIMTLQQCK